jgi:hypothetical protein
MFFYVLPVYVFTFFVAACILVVLTRSGFLHVACVWHVSVFCMLMIMSWICTCRSKISPKLYTYWVPSSGDQESLWNSPTIMSLMVP